MRRLLTLLALLVAAPAHAQFANDTFTEPTIDTVLSSHTPDSGGAWVQHGSYTGVLTVSQATDRILGDGIALGVYYHNASPATANYTVAADVVVSSNAAASYPGVTCRTSTSADTMYRGWYDQPNTRWVMDKIVAGGAAVTLGTPFTQTLSNSTTYNMVLRCDGDQISLNIDGGSVEIPAVTDTAIAAAGKAGVFQLTASVADIDTFVATDIAAGGSGATGGLLMRGAGGK